MIWELFARNQLTTVVTTLIDSLYYKERKANHIKKFKELKPDEIPERTKLTMFDLIYYNPTDGNKMSNPSSRRTSRAPSPERDSAQCKFLILYFRKLGLE